MDFNIGNAGIFTVGSYNFKKFNQQHVRGVTSLIVPEGLYVKLFKEDNFLGEEKIVVGPKMIDTVRDKDWQGWQKNIRSMYVLRQEELRVNCKWVRVSSVNGGPLKETVSVDWTLSD